MIMNVSGGVEWAVDTSKQAVDCEVRSHLRAQNPCVSLGMLRALARSAQEMHGVLRIAAMAL